MPRTPHKPAATLPEPETVAEAHAITLAEEREAKQIEQDMFALAMQDVGSLRALEFIGQMAGRAQVEIYIRQKKTKAYRAVTYTNAEGKTDKCPDLDTFCELYLGESARNLRRKAENYHLLGAELYEVSERLGFKGQDYTALKALPAADQEVIKQAMQAEDRSQVIDLLQEMAARHASEKAALQAEATEAKETAEARDEVIRAKEETISKLELRAATAERRKANFTDIEEAGYECGPLHEAVAATIVGLKKIEREVARLMHEVGGDIVMEECVTAVLVAARRAVQINREYRLGIPDATLLDLIDEDEREATELRALGMVKPEAPR